MLLDTVIIALLAWLIFSNRRKNTIVVIQEYTPTFYNEPLTEEEIKQTEIIVEATLYKYPDAACGDAFPEIKYKVWSDLYNQGKIPKPVYQKEIDKILKLL